ncbi:MAG: pilus assembly protein PilP [Syntrophobacteraceae bacterium]|jgi:Tfp pilus assembly protein PilP|nr:pilus assembly protein PilP [Syntrophobacteraceae bacterium]
MKGLSLNSNQKSIAVSVAAIAVGLVLMGAAPPRCWATAAGEPAGSGAPVMSEKSSAVEEMTAPQAASPSMPRKEVLPSEAALQVQKELLQPQFAYNPKVMLDPFKPFIQQTEAPPPVTSLTEEDLDAPPPEPQRPLTPLQRMRISEVEAGLKAIMWGPLGRRAIIEDASGKGYIVSVGTPVGERNGVVSEIFNDHLVIQQENWDRKEKRMIPDNIMVKLKKTTK